MNRTPDLLITNELLYRLSYTGETGIIAWFQRRSGGATKGRSIDQLDPTRTGQTCADVG
jgi:hypothetical protein